MPSRSMGHRNTRRFDGDELLGSNSAVFRELVPPSDPCRFRSVAAQLSAAFRFTVQGSVPPRLSPQRQRAGGSGDWKGCERSDDGVAT